MAKGGKSMGGGNKSGKPGKIVGGAGQKLCGDKKNMSKQGKGSY